MVRYVTYEEFNHVVSALSKGLEHVEVDLREFRDETRLSTASLRADIADLRQDVTRLDERLGRLEVKVDQLDAKVDLILQKISKN